MSRRGEGAPPIEVEAAIARLLETIPAKRPEVTMRVTDDDLLGRVLAEPIHADRDHPPFDRATMDGYAVRTADLATGARLPVLGSIPAGGAMPEDVAAGGCVSIATGAAVPESLDAVVEHEATDRGDPLAVAAKDVREGRNIHRRGADAKAGDVLVPRGTRVDAAARAVAIAGGAAVGTGLVSIRRPPRVAIVTTGDELRPADDPLDRDGDAVRIRDSNRPLLVDLIADRWTFGGSLTRARHVTDEPAATARELDAAADDADLVVTVGGVSAGTLDLVPGHWSERGWKTLVRGVRMQPGKPFSAWLAPDGRTLAVGLPGNPVSAFACLHVLLRPWFDAFRGVEEPAAWRPMPLHTTTRANPRRPAFRPANLVITSDGIVEVAIPGWRGSGDLPHLVGTTGFARLPVVDGEVPAGTPVEFLPHRGDPLLRTEATGP
ncbi:MAG: hypothetical protein CMJ54_11935 [Planctomycetaceae bacterium]|nr:hypothetical protein [Planctomycetaceae bacterium]